MKHILYICLLAMFTACAVDSKDLKGFWELDQSSIKVDGIVVSQETLGPLFAYGKDEYHLVTSDLIMYMTKDHPSEEMYYEIADGRINFYEYRSLKNRGEKELIISMKVESMTSDEVVLTFSEADIPDTETANVVKMILAMTVGKGDITLTYKRLAKPLYGEAADYQKYLEMTIDSDGLGKADTPETVVDAEAAEEVVDESNGH